MRPHDVTTSALCSRHPPSNSTSKAIRCAARADGYPGSTLIEAAAPINVRSSRIRRSIDVDHGWDLTETRRGLTINRAITALARASLFMDPSRTNERVRNRRRPDRTYTGPLQKLSAERHQAPDDRLL
jgi:hypothetical protein